MSQPPATPQLSSAINVTVILCTHNRCESLAQALESLAASTLPNSIAWEVLVVDNNSTDKTREVTERYCDSHPNHFRYLYEPRLGKSNALNSGIASANGNILAFTDDDVVVEPTWLLNLTAPLQADAWVGCGGRTLPERGFSPPRWIPRRGLYALAPLAVFDRGTTPRELRESPFGNNMAYKKSLFEKYGGFRLDLGPRAGSSEAQKSEDSEFGNRILAAGERLLYEPSAVLYHAVPQSRVQQAYFLSWWFDKARADVRGFGTEPAAKWVVRGIPVVLFRRFAVWLLRWTLEFEASARFECKLKVWGLAGQIVGCYRLFIEASTKRAHDARS